MRRSPRKRTYVQSFKEPSGLTTSAPSPDREETNELRTQIDILQQENVLLKQEIENLKSKLQNCSYTYNSISEDEKLFRSETGLSTDSFETLFQFLNPGEDCVNMKMYQTTKQEDQDSDILKSPSSSSMPKREPSGKKQGPAPKLTAKNQMFLFLCWLKGGLTLRHISWLFHVPKSTVSRYITSWANFIYFVLGSVPIWPSKKVIKQMMPENFKVTYL